MTYGCIRFIDSYPFLTVSSDSLVKTLIDISHETLKKFENEIVDIDELLINVGETKTLIKEDKYKKDSIKDLKKDYPVIIEASINYLSENDTEFPDNKWKF